MVCGAAVGQGCGAPLEGMLLSESRRTHSAVGKDPCHSSALEGVELGSLLKDLRRLVV